MTTETKSPARVNFTLNTTFLPGDPSSRPTPRQRVRYSQPVSAHTNGVDLYLAGKASAQALDPVVLRKGGLANPGSLVMGFGGIVFVLYVFNLMGTQTFFDTNLLHLNRTVQAEDGLVSRGVLAGLPYLATALVLAILIPMVISLRQSIQESLRSRRLSSRRPVTMQEFIELAKAEDISPKVAREAYVLLKPFYNNRMRARLSDDLANDLDLGMNERADIFGTMLYQTDRRLRAGDAYPHIETVRDLLASVERASPRSIGRNASGRM